MESLSAKKRKANWTPCEIEILIEEVERRSKVLFSTFSNNLTNKMKKESWEAVATRISSNGQVKRDSTEVKKKWTDMKSQTRKRAANIHREKNKTGGGPPPTDLSEMEQKVVSLIPSCQIQGCDGGLESGECEVIPELAVAAVFPDDVDILVTSEDVVMDILPSTSSMKTTTASQGKGKSMTTPVESAQGKCDSIIKIEEKKLLVLEQLLTTQKEILATEKRRLEVEEEKLSLIKDIDMSGNCLSPVIKFI